MSTPNPTGSGSYTPPVTSAQDPTLGLLSHVISVGVGLAAGWLSLHIPGVTLSTDTQLEITSAVVGAVVTGVHYIQARLSAAKKVAK
jgi:hypothetical protein